MHRGVSRFWRGFTLVELLVVIASIGGLAGLLLPGLARCRQRANQVSEVNAARQLLIAWQLYADDNDYVYRASLYPSLGYNAVFLGGDEQAFNPELAAAFGSDCGTGPTRRTCATGRCGRWLRREGWGSTPPRLRVVCVRLRGG